MSGSDAPRSEYLPHVAMPRLVGLPAYARPPRQYVPSARGFDPDDLPLEAYREPEDELDAPPEDLTHR